MSRHPLRIDLLVKELHHTLGVLSGMVSAETHRLLIGTALGQPFGIHHFLLSRTPVHRATSTSSNAYKLF